MRHRQRSGSCFGHADALNFWPNKNVESPRRNVYIFSTQWGPYSTCSLAHPVLHGRLHNARVCARLCTCVYRYTYGDMCVAGGGPIWMTWCSCAGAYIHSMSTFIELSRRAEKKRLAYAAAGTKRGDRCRRFFWQNYRYIADFFLNTAVVTTRLPNNCRKPLQTFDEITNKKKKLRDIMRKYMRNKKLKEIHARSAIVHLIEI